jgi:DNA-binding transcriptional LysR family regulator
MRNRRPTSTTTLDELQAAAVFLQVVKANGFTAAAKVLGKSTSTLSRIVSELERHLGAQLLTRTTRRLHVTEAGTLYAVHAEALLATARAGHDAIVELTGGVPRGHLRVTMPVAVGERVLGPQVAELRRRHPELRLELDLSDKNVSLVERGFDLAIRVGRLPDSSLRAQLLGKIPVLLVASPRYIAKHGAPKHPEQLVKHACIALGALPGVHEWSFHKRGSRPKRIAIDGVIHTNSPTLAAQMAASGIGLLRVVEWIIRGELERGDLVEVMPDWSCDDPADGGMPVHVVYAQTAGVTPPLKSRVFVELVKDLVEREGLRAPRRATSSPSAGSTSRASRT